MPQKSRKQKIAASHRRQTGAAAPIVLEVTQQPTGHFSIPQNTQVNQERPATPKATITHTFHTDALEVRKDLVRIGLYTIIFLAAEGLLFWLLVVRNLFSLF